MVLDDRTGDVYVTRLDTNELLRITPGGVITPIATNADGLLGAANMTLIHVGQSTVIYLANTGSPSSAATPAGRVRPSSRSRSRNRPSIGNCGCGAAFGAAPRLFARWPRLVLSV